MEFPVYDAGGQDQTIQDYLYRVQKFMSKEKDADYKLILGFIEKWLVDKNIEFHSLCQVKNLRDTFLPDNRKCKRLLKKDAESLAKKLDVHYKFDAEKIQKHYERLEKKNTPIRKKRLNMIGEIKDPVKRKEAFARYFKSIDPAYDYDNPFCSEMIHFIRLILRKIDYVLKSTRKGKMILWSIHQNRDTRRTKKGMKHILLQQCGQEKIPVQYFKRKEPDTESETETESDSGSENSVETNESNDKDNNDENKEGSESDNDNDNDNDYDNDNDNDSDSDSDSVKCNDSSYGGNDIDSDSDDSVKSIEMADLESDSEDSEGIICEF